jgi:hypothetical protein
VPGVFISYGGTGNGHAGLAVGMLTIAKAKRLVQT